MLEQIYTRIERLDPDNPLPPGLPGVDYAPTVTPNNISMPFEVRDGVKVMHMVAGEVRHKFADGIECYTWGYNGRTHGPTIEAVEGERLRIYVTNTLPAPTSVHWHGFVLPHGMDGVSGLEQPAILPGETFKYEWTVRQHGTFMYHSHHDTMTQEGMGLTGMFIVHPRRELYAPEELGPQVDRDFAIMLHQWHVDVGASRPNPWSMEYNLLTMNAVVSPYTEPLITRLGDRVRVRFGNLSAIHHHPIHLHGYQFVETAVDGWRLPPAEQRPAVTVFMPVGRTKDLEVVANNPGDWIFHCHMTHHVDEPDEQRLPQHDGHEQRRRPAGPRVAAGLHDDGRRGHERPHRPADGAGADQLHPDADGRGAVRHQHRRGHGEPAEGPRRRDRRAARRQRRPRTVPVAQGHARAAGDAGGTGPRRNPCVTQHRKEIDMTLRTVSFGTARRDRPDRRPSPAAATRPNDDPANEVIRSDRTGGLTPRAHRAVRTRPPGHALPARRSAAKPPVDAAGDAVPPTADDPAVIDKNTDARVRRQLRPL